MKALPFTIPKTKRDALILQEDKETIFYDLLHRHDEFQISYILSGEGTLIVGDTINSYSPGSVLVLGGNLPHVFKTDPKRTAKSHMRSIFFTKESFGLDFFNKIEELKSLQPFFKKSENGFRVLSNLKKIATLIDLLFKASKLDRFIRFFELLKMLNRSKSESLSSFKFDKKYSENEGLRMSVVFDYTVSNYHQEISLSTIAKQASMTKNAFCKYFKKCTNKTYITFLNELRVEESCKRMQRSNEPSVAEIAEQCGFQNISNFNRIFKKVKGTTPREFRKQRFL